MSLWPPPGDGSVRLVSGANACQGRVEIFYRGHWGTVCDDDWGMSDVGVVCRQVGCGAICSGEQAPRPPGPRGSPPSAQGLVSAAQIGVPGRRGRVPEAGPRARGPARLPSSHCPAGGGIRLASGNSSCQGRVEVQFRGAWGTVCDDDWGFPDAQVVCRQVGCGPAVVPTVLGYFGYGAGPILLDNVACAGTEAHLADCFHLGWGQHNCGHHEDAGVIWFLRLVNGSHRCEGRVEMFYLSQWGTVCDDAWDLTDVKVVCRQLGCGGALAASGEARYGQGAGYIFLDNLKCKGNEPSLLRCSHIRWNVHNCDHSEDAGRPAPGHARVEVAESHWDPRPQEPAPIAPGLDGALPPSLPLVLPHGERPLSSEMGPASHPVLARCTRACLQLPELVFPPLPQTFLGAVTPESMLLDLPTLAPKSPHMQFRMGASQLLCFETAQPESARIPPGPLHELWTRDARKQ
uniref:Soluble scavenger receptor cysteine-rich domain-containing protein SSC5D n=1 Tax=Varanus komodoensis TaxID=61221 RepID=A0A8D2IUV8_VARKO